MNLEPKDFVKLEFPDVSKMTSEDWLRKMNEYAILQNSKIDLSHIISLKNENKNTYQALKSAIDALYFNDSSDFRNALYNVVKELSNIELDNLDEDVIRAIYKLTE